MGSVTSDPCPDRSAIVKMRDTIHTFVTYSDKF